MNDELIKKIKDVKQALADVDCVGEEWDERQAAIQKLEDITSYINDLTARGIELE